MSNLYRCIVNYDNQQLYSRVYSERYYVDVTYNGVTNSYATGRNFKLLCAGDVALTDIRIQLRNSLETLVLKCAGKIMDSDVIVSTANTVTTSAEIPSFSTATVDELKDIKASAITNSTVKGLVWDKWAVGDERTVTLNTITPSSTADYFNARQITGGTYTLVLMHKLTTNTLGGAEGIWSMDNPMFVVGFKELMDAGSTFNPLHITPDGELIDTSVLPTGNFGYGDSDVTQLHISSVINMFPDIWQNIFSTFRIGSTYGNFTASGTLSNHITQNRLSNKYFALPQLHSVTGEYQYSMQETSIVKSIPQMTYYQTAANRIKYRPNQSTANAYLTSDMAYYRTSGGVPTRRWVNINASGAKTTTTSATTNFYWSPIGVI